MFPYLKATSSIVVKKNAEISNSCNQYEYDKLGFYCCSFIQSDCSSVQSFYKSWQKQQWIFEVISFFMDFFMCTIAVA